MKKEKYRTTFKRMLKESGRKKQWVYQQMKMPRQTFHRKVHNDTLTDAQKIKVAQLLSS